MVDDNKVFKYSSIQVYQFCLAVSVNKPGNKHLSKLKYCIIQSILHMYLHECTLCKTSCLPRTVHYHCLCKVDCPYGDDEILYTNFSAFLLWLKTAQFSDRESHFVVNKKLLYWTLKDCNYKRLVGKAAGKGLWGALIFYREARGPSVCGGEAEFFGVGGGGPVFFQCAKGGTRIFWRSKRGDQNFFSKKF